MLENYSPLVSLGITFSKPKLIKQLEQSDEPWREESKCLVDLCSEPRTEFQYHLSCGDFFKSTVPQTIYAMPSFPSDLPSSARSHFSLEVAHCSSEKEEDGKREGPDTLYRRLQLSGTSRAFFSPSQGQPTQVEGKRDGGTDRDPVQRRALRSQTHC